MLRATPSIEPSELERHYREMINDGYTVSKTVFSESEVAGMLSAFERLMKKVRTKPESFEGTRYTSREARFEDTWGVSNIFVPELYEPALASIFGHPRFMAPIHRILGSDLRFWSAHGLWSPEKVDYELNWHKDNYETDYYLTSGRPTHVQFNVCLTDDSSFRVIPGSHRRPISDSEREAIESKWTGQMPGEVAVRCEPGDVVYFNHHAIHRGTCSAKETRRTLHMRLQRRDEPTGGGTSLGYMREQRFIEMVEPALASLMRSLIEWDDAHPITKPEAIRRLMIRRGIRTHEAGAKKPED